MVESEEDARMIGECEDGRGMDVRNCNGQVVRRGREEKQERMLRGGKPAWS